MIFYKDENTNITWDILIEDLNNTKSYNKYCKLKNNYDIFKCIIVSMIINEEIILLDYSFTNEELKKIVGDFEFDNKKVILHINNKNDLIDKLKKTSANWNITLFTSGTTGIPKKISHNFNTITRFIKYSNEKNIWGFAYNPTHIAGIQVFLQALLNGNTIINLFELSSNYIFSEILKHKITHISATPTFYRLLFPCNKEFLSVQRITSGGEKINQNLIDQLKKIFPIAKITNVYASTEIGTLLASNNDIFTIKKEYAHLIKIEDNELLVHNSMIGQFKNDDNWYHTGDLVNIINENPLQFNFIYRKNEIINVGGYKINPIEVEEIILTYPNINDVRVYSKINSILGNIICCDIVCDKKIEEYDIRKYLQTKIQEIKIPRIFYFVEKIQMTRTGKIKRL